MATPDTPGPDATHQRPEGVSDITIEALGKLSEALEVLEHARGYLYGFHRLTGTAVGRASRRVASDSGGPGSRNSS